MFTFLDLLVIVFLVLIAATLLSLCLMFMLKNKTAKRICFYIVLVLSLYVSSIGLRIGLGGWFTTQIAFGVLTVLMTVSAFVLERVSKGNEKLLKISRVIAAAALAVGMINAIL